MCTSTSTSMSAYHDSAWRSTSRWTSESTDIDAETVTVDATSTGEQALLTVTVFWEGGSRGKQGADGEDGEGVGEHDAFWVF